MASSPIDGGRAEAITAETIRRIFEVDVTIDYTDGGVPFLLPQTMRPVQARQRHNAAALIQRRYRCLHRTVSQL